MLTAAGVTAAPSNRPCSCPLGVDADCVCCTHEFSSAPPLLTGRASFAGVAAAEICSNAFAEEYTGWGADTSRLRDKRGPSESPVALGVGAAAARCESRRARSKPSTALSTTPLSGVSASGCCIYALKLRTHHQSLMGKQGMFLPKSTEPRSSICTRPPNSWIMLICTRVHTSRSEMPPTPLESCRALGRANNRQGGTLRRANSRRGRPPCADAENDAWSPPCSCSSAACRP